MNGYTFHVAGIAAPDQRPRVTKNGGIIRDERTHAWKQHVARTWAAGRFPRTGGAVRVTMLFSMLRPEGHVGATGRLLSSAPRLHTSRPDCDNLGKAVIDAMLDAGAWLYDDAQVAEMITRKQWCDDGRTPGVKVRVTFLEPPLTRVRGRKERKIAVSLSADEVM